VSQPPPYNRSFSFSNFQAQNPNGTLPGSSIDLELNDVKSSIDGIESNLARIQRDDGALMNGSVTYDTLSPSLQTAGIAPALPWVTTGKAFSIGASVTHGRAFYRALVAHTSGVFATDLAAGNWILIVDFSTIALVNASQIAVTPSGSPTSNVQTSLQALDTGKAPLNHTQLASTISDSTTAGRALLTAADATAQNVLLGTTLLGFQSGDVKETATLSLPIGWYYCDGSSKNRVTDVNLFNAITIQQTGVVTSGSSVITGLSDTTNGGGTPMSPGMAMSGTGIPSGAFIQSVDSATQITMNATATGSGTTPLVFAPYGVGDGSTTFGLPNRAYVAVGRDNASGSASNVTHVSTTFSVTSGSTSASVASASGLAVGMFVLAPKVPMGTTIAAISGTSVTLSNAATATVTSGAVRFSSIFDPQTLGARGGSTIVTTTLVTANLPAYTPSGSVTVTSTVSNIVRQTTPFFGNVQAGTGGGISFNGQPDVIAVTSTGSLAGAAQGGTSAAIVRPSRDPSIVMNFIIKR
jgi:hypothetical protein